jgi:hypothetical protein
MFRGYDAIKALAKEVGVRVPDLLVLAEKNDPFYAGSPAQRAKAKWFASLWARFGYTTGVHLRRVHYRLVSGKARERKHDGMPVAVARQLEFWLQDYAPGADIKLTPLGLTREQVITYQLPRIPIKDSDARKAGFEERYGEGAVELDALEALYPGTLAELVRKAVEPYRDLDLAARFEAVEAEAQRLAADAWRQRIASYQDELDDITEEVRTIVARYQPQLAQMNADLQAELAPWRERVERLRRAVAVEMVRFRPALPVHPEAETEPVDEETWLFDAQRDYLTQLSIYKARKNGRASDELTA